MADMLVKLCNRHHGTQAFCIMAYEIRSKAAELLASDKRYEKADQAYSDAKKMLAEVYLAQSLSKARSCAGAAIEFIENAVMLYNGQYFRKGTKRGEILRWKCNFQKGKQ